MRIGEQRPVNIQRRLRGLIPISLYRAESNELRVGWGKSLSVRDIPMLGWAIRDSEEVVTTTLDVLFDYAENFDDSKFVAAIIHVSRCGSTALANAFKAIPDILVLSEPSIFCHLIREAGWSGVPVDDEQRSTLVRGFLGAMLKENPASNIVVKCSSVSTITLDQTLRYMPSVPWCFLSRTPADVIASLQASPGMWLRTPAVREHIMRQIGRDSPHSGHAERSRDLYAYLLEHFYLAVMKHANEYTTFLDYSDFNIDNVCEVVEQTLHRAVDSSMRQAISASLQVYSKGVTRRPFSQPKALARPSGYPELDAVYERYRAFAKSFYPRRLPGDLSFA
jgi:hypothetical protein